MCESAEPALDAILRAASASEAGIPRSRILRTTDKLFASVAGTETPQGVAALFRKPDWQFEDILRGAADENGARFGDSPLVVVMAGVQDPGNVGTIVRSAEAFGATGAIAARRNGRSVVAEGIARFGGVGPALAAASRDRDSGGARAVENGARENHSGDWTRCGWLASGRPIAGSTSVSGSPRAFGDIRRK